VSVVWRAYPVGVAQRSDWQARTVHVVGQWAHDFVTARHVEVQLGQTRGQKKVVSLVSPVATANE
jgi:hypothetical protein